MHTVRCIFTGNVVLHIHIRIFIQYIDVYPFTYVCIYGHRLAASTHTHISIMYIHLDTCTYRVIAECSNVCGGYRMWYNGIIVTANAPIARVFLANFYHCDNRFLSKEARHSQARPCRDEHEHGSCYLDRARLGSHSSFPRL